MADLTEDRPRLPAARAFVVQFRAPEDGKPESLKGKVEHISSGQAQNFSSMEELCVFMEQVLKGLANPTP
jgi:hypothetical protein